MTITTAPFGKTVNGEQVNSFLMENNNGMKVKVLDFGCIIQSIIVPDTNGNPADVVQGYDDVEAYEKGSCFYGVFVGRYANRIGNSEFQLDGETVKLTPNEGKNHLHGAYTQKVFQTEIKEDTLIFRYTSPDGEEGYPGTLEMEISYQLTDENAIILSYRATTDKKTVVNLTNHSYFNLNGHDSGSAQKHLLQINADAITEVDTELIPTGKLLSVAGTPFDFREAKPIGSDLDLAVDQLKISNGYDHNFALNTKSEQEMFAKAVGDQTGIVMTCYTSQPGVQFYNANYALDDPMIGRGKGGASYGQRSAFCLETQHYPDSPNHPEFPSTVLEPGDAYHQVTKYAFSVK